MKNINLHSKNNILIDEFLNIFSDLEYFRQTYYERYHNLFCDDTTITDKNFVGKGQDDIRKYFFGYDPRVLYVIKNQFRYVDSEIAMAFVSISEEGGLARDFIRLRNLCLNTTFSNDKILHINFFNQD